jgi:hypothetical protein
MQTSWLKQGLTALPPLECTPSAVGLERTPGRVIEVLAALLAN